MDMKLSKPIDLTTYAQRYRVGKEQPGSRDPWDLFIRCRFGHVYPHGGRYLAASIDGYPRIAARLRRLPCVQIVQDGDHGELTVVFDVRDFDAVAEVIQPRRRRILTDQERQRRAESLAKARQNRSTASATASAD